MTEGARVFLIHSDSQMLESVVTITEAIGYLPESFSSVEEFLDRYRGEGDGCIVAALKLPGMSGLDLLRETKERSIPLPVIILSENADVASAVQVMKEGAVTMMEAPYQEQELRDAIALAIDRSKSERAVTRRRQLVNARIKSLTEKERKVLDLMVEGLANKVIAKRLGVSIRTVESRRHDVFRKMEVRTIVDLVRDVLTVQQP